MFANETGIVSKSKRIECQWEASCVWMLFEQCSSQKVRLPTFLGLSRCMRVCLVFGGDPGDSRMLPAR